MKPQFHLFASVLILSISSCCMHDADLIDQDATISNVWIHSHEESGGNSSMTYRPEEYKEFPLLDLRNRLELKEDGSASYMIQSLSDPNSVTSHYYVKGTWTIDWDSQTILIKNSRGELKYAFHIHEFTDNKFKLSYQKHSEIKVVRDTQE